jgi:hypothetical protein
MATMVYRFGVRRTDDDGRPYALPAEADHQIRLAHQMRNALVEIQHDYESTKLAVWSSHPQVAAIEEQLAAVTARIEELTKQAKAQHSADRTIATRPATSADLKAAKKEATTLRATRKAALSVAYPVVRPQLDACEAARLAAIKACRQDYAAKGLHWGTYNKVLEQHKTACKLVKRKRAQGLPAELHYHRFDGTGTISVQLQRQAGDPPRTPETVASDTGKWANVLQLPWMTPDEFGQMPLSRRRETGRAARARFHIGGKTHLDLPMHVHRMMPPEADICAASLTVTRVAAQEHYKLSVTVQVPDPEPVEGRPAVAVHYGWRTRPDGCVRVATWAASKPLGPVPPQLDGVVRVHDGGQWGEIVLPKAWLDQAEHPAVLRGQRDVAFDAVKAQVANWLDANPQPEQENTLLVTGGVVRQWRSASRLAGLILHWRTTPPVGADVDALLTMAEAWRKQDKHLWEWESHERSKVTNRRDNAWRDVAAWLGKTTGLVIADNIDLAALRQRGPVEDTDPVPPNVAQQRARARAALVAPGRLRQLMQLSAQRRGVGIVEADVAYLKRTCPHCDVVGDADPQYAASIMVVCHSCGDTYDQDRAVVARMLHRERSGGESEAGERSHK